MTAPTDLPKRRWFWAGFVLLGLAGIAGLARIISVAIDKVASGQGLETYRTVWLVEFNYVGVLVLFAVVVLALLVGGAMWLHDWWQWRSLERKYGGSRGNT
jgi:hypothetical protein